MALARFFDRIYASAGRALTIDRAGLETAMQSTCVGVEVEGALVGSEGASWTSEFLVNLLSRLYPRLALSGPSVVVDRLAALATAVNPAIELGGIPTISVTLGSASPGHEAIYPGASGWQVQLSEHAGTATFGPANPFSAAAAASLAAGEVFRRVFASKLANVPFRETSFSLLDYSPSAGRDMPLGAHDVGDLAFVGVGAVANSAIWALCRHPSLSGRVRLIDDDCLDLSNLQRYCLATDRDEGRVKIELAAEHLRNTGLEEVCLVRGHLADFAGREQLPPVVCVSVDNILGRRGTQALLPRLVVNGYTGHRGLGASWHELGNGHACLACLYHPRGRSLSQIETIAATFGLEVMRVGELWMKQLPVESSDVERAAKHLRVDRKKLQPWIGRQVQDFFTEVVCGGVVLEADQLGRVESVPLAHQSALAGILMAVEVLKRTQEELRPLAQPENVIQWDDVLHPPPSVWSQLRRPREGCICTDPDYVERYRVLWPEVGRTSNIAATSGADMPLQPSEVSR